MFREECADVLFGRHHALESELETDGTVSYPGGADRRMRRLDAPVGEEDALARSLPTGQPFPEVPAALEEARSRSWKLAILSRLATTTALKCSTIPRGGGLL